MCKSSSAPMISQGGGVELTSFQFHAPTAFQAMAVILCIGIILGIFYMFARRMGMCGGHRAHRDGGYPSLDGWMTRHHNVCRLSRYDMGQGIQEQREMSRMGHGKDTVFNVDNWEKLGCLVFNVYIYDDFKISKFQNFKISKFQNISETKIIFGTNFESWFCVFSFTCVYNYV